MLYLAYITVILLAHLSRPTTKIRENKIEKSITMPFKVHKK